MILCIIMFFDWFRPFSGSGGACLDIATHSASVWEDKSSELITLSVFFAIKFAISFAKCFLIIIVVPQLGFLHPFFGYFPLFSKKKGVFHP